MKGRTIGQRLEALGHAFFYLVMLLGGQRGGYLLLVPVVFVYAVTSGAIHRRMAPYLGRRFPGQGRGRRFLAGYKNLLAFGQILVDRGWLGIKSRAAMTGTTPGYEVLEDLLARGKGVVLITAHVGNWQTALAHLGKLSRPVHALMRYDQGAAAKHYFDVGGKQRQFAIIDAEGPFGGMVEAAAALARGEVVTIMGDRYIKGSFSRVQFLGSEVRLPDSAYVLASCAQAPVVIMLSAKTGRRRYELKIWDVLSPEYRSRDERSVMTQACARRFARALEKYLKQYPYQWYNFFDFWKQ